MPSVYVVFCCSAVYIIFKARTSGYWLYFLMDEFFVFVDDALGFVLCLTQKNYPTSYTTNTATNL